MRAPSAAVRPRVVTPVVAGVSALALLSPTAPQVLPTAAASGTASPVAAGGDVASPAATVAGDPDVPGLTDESGSGQLAARHAEPVVLTGAQLPGWASAPAEGAPAPYPAGSDPEEHPAELGDGLRSAHHGTLPVPPDAGSGVDVDRVAAYRWDGLAWVEVPVQVDERFPHFLANGRSGFSPYSGVDTELTYAWNPTPHALGEEAWKHVAGECTARYPTADELDGLAAAGVITPGAGEQLADYTAARPDPVAGLDADDEVVLMASDLGALAPPDAAGPHGTDGGTRQQVAVTDPLTGDVRYVYLFLRDGGSSFTHEDGYVTLTRHDTAGWWADRASWAPDDPEQLGTSNTGYGPNLPGTACVEADGTDYALGSPRPSEDRFPLDGLTVTTDRYEWTATGRWMIRSMRVTRPGSVGEYGDDLVDRWKGRAFQQSPDSEISLVGFEDEQVNWEANSAVLGWRVGPVRAIREVWGADSGTNVTKTETFYRDAVRYTYRVRVHPIPPDGLYTSWDYDHDVAARYFNALRPDGVAVDGENDDVGQVDGFGSFDAFFDAPDPTFDLPTAVERWEQVSGRDDAGSLVYVFELDEATSALNPAVVPYYRDDRCLDDGTGDDPVARPLPGEDSQEAYPEELRTCTEDNWEQRQGAFASHGLHFFATHDSDNAFTGVPTTEIVGSQWQFAVPTERPRSVGEPYAQVVRVPLTATATPQPNTPADDQPGTLLAGAAVVDTTWHVGASQGQYAGTPPLDPCCTPGFVTDRDEDGQGVDPSVHATTSRATDGIESRQTARALVLDDGRGHRWALVTNDLYIPQDLLNRRVATLLEEHDLAHPQAATGIGPDQLTVTVSHSHSSPYYSTPSWGVWAFQDVFDLRYFEFVARRMADAVIAATGDLEPARIGAGTTDLTLTKRNPEGPTVADDGTPAAYPHSDTDPTLTVVRVEGADGDLIANWVVFGRHPEGMDDNGLHTGEYVGALQRTVDRERGGVTLFSQNDVGTGEIARDTRGHPAEARQEFDDNSHNELERVARLFADAVEEVTDRVAAATEDGAGTVAMRSDVPIGVQTMRFAPPSYRLFPTVSNCRSDEAFAGNPGVPIVGLPECGFVVEEVEDATGFDLPGTGVTYEDLRRAGVPIPDNYGGPSYTGLQETLQVPLQAVRIGEIGVTICPCEQWTDQSRNIRSRLDRTPGNLYFGWDWTANYLHHPGWEPGVRYDGAHGPLQLPDADGATWCRDTGDGGWICKDPRDPRQELPAVSDATFRRWKARIYNDARGWDRPENSARAESEPTDPAEVWGNWTIEELHGLMDGGGYGLVVPVSMANDYWGYIPTYREFQARDYYRKSLAGLGPHSADFLTTRLTRMAAELKGAPADLVELGPKDRAYQWDEAHQTARAELLGQVAEATLTVYEAQLPPDGDEPRITVQPGDIARFQAAMVQWIGGSNYTDVPHARVERLDEATGAWLPFGDGFGEVQLEVDFPGPEELVAYEAGEYAWRWTATFEAYDSDVPHAFADGVTRQQVPAGTYRFVVEGCHREAVPTGANDPACSAWDATGRVASYELTSQPFEVRPWEGITVEDVQLSDDGETVTFRTGPDYPYPLSASNAALTTIESDAGDTDDDGPRTYLLGAFDYGQLDAVDYPEHPSASAVAGDGTATTVEHPVDYLGPRDPERDLRDYDGDGQPDEVFCFRCSFETWADTGAVERVAVTVVRRGDRVEVVDAVYDPLTGRWTATVDLRPGERAFVDRGGVVDTFGETNREPSATVVGPAGPRPFPGAVK